MAKFHYHLIWKNSLHEFVAKWSIIDNIHTLNILYISSVFYFCFSFFIILFSQISLTLPKVLKISLFFTYGAQVLKGLMCVERTLWGLLSFGIVLHLEVSTTIQDHGPHSIMHSKVIHCLRNSYRICK